MSRWGCKLSWVNREVADGEEDEIGGLGPHVDYKEIYIFLIKVLTHDDCVDSCFIVL